MSRPIASALREEVFLQPQRSNQLPAQRVGRIAGLSEELSNVLSESNEAL